MSDAPAPAPAAAPAAKGKSKLLLIGVAVLVLAGGGGGGYWWWSHRAPAEGAEVEAPKAEPGIVSFEPFVANLADEGGNRFLRASVKLVVDGGPEKGKEIEENAVERAQLQSAILEVLTEQLADELITPEGKAAMKKAILTRTGEVLHETPVTDVLLTEFVVQF
jgi:flagellar protein FliL